jgi:uncharacterized protein (TIRG00374 family)
LSSRLRTASVSLLAIALLAWFLRDADFAAVWTHVRGARISLLVVGLACVGASLWVRAVRWQYLLDPIGPTRFRTVFRAAVIGFAALAVLPARVGDILRPYLVARQDGLPVSSAIATIVMERVLDLIAVLALMALYVWGLADTSTWPAALLRPIEVSTAVGGIGSIALMALMWVLATHPERIGTFVTGVAQVLPRRWAVSLGSMAASFSSGFAIARAPRDLLMALVLSFPLWIIVAAETWAVTEALHIAMPFAGTFLLQAMLVVGVAVPTPGGVGSYHEAYRIGVTTFFGAPNDQAVAAAILVHIISFVPTLLIGVIFMAQDGLSFGRLKQMAATPPVHPEHGRGAPGKETDGHDEVPILRSSRR